jgi:hypothetical protein
VRRQRFGRHAAWLLPAAVAVVAAPGCGEDNALVGGSCARGYVQCGVRCVLRCSTEDGSLDGADAMANADASSDATMPDARPPDGAPDDGGPDGAPSDATVDGSGDDGSAGDAPDDVDSGCNPPFDTPNQCGDCQTQCGDAAPLCVSNGVGGFGCAVPCPAGETYCNGVCVDLTSDPANCGACGLACPSQICEQSQCVGSTPGGVVFIGHDFDTATSLRTTAQARVLSNAVFLGQPRGPGNDVHVLVYTGFADATAITQVDTLLHQATPPGENLVDPMTMNAADVAGLTFASYSVLLVLDQPRAQAGVDDLGAVGASWSSAVTAFAQAGGIVVFLDGGTGGDQMPALVSATGLLSVSSDTALPGGGGGSGTRFDVLPSGDVVAVGVTSPYAAAGSSVSVVAEPNGGNVVYVVAPQTDAASAPTVIHKVF